MSNARYRGYERVLLMVLSVAILAVVFGAGALRLHAPRARAQSPSGDSLALQLAERLLATPFTPYGPPTNTGSVQLFPGALPADLPLNLPLPPGSTLIGSDERPSISPPTPVYVGAAFPVVSTATPPGVHVDIVLDAGGSADDAAAFYKNTLTDLGWFTPTQNYGQSGFVSSPAPLIPVTYCRSSDGPWLSVTARPTDGGPVDLRLSFDSGGFGSQCRTSPGPGPTIAPPIPGPQTLPSLNPPPGVTVRGNGGSGGGLGRFGTDAVAITDMSVADLDAFYANQLIAKGWSKLSSGGDAALTWSTWSVPDHSDLQGFLYVRDGPISGQRSLHVEVASTDPNAQSYTGGAYGYSSFGNVGSVSTLSPIAGAVGVAGLPSATPTATPAAGR